MARRAFLLGLASAVLAWAAWDLFGPRAHDLRDFEPREVARLETEMWRSYYERAHLRLFRQLATLMRGQYHLPLLRSYVVAYHAARAAAVFQDGRGRPDYEKALPQIVAFYAAIDRASSPHFDVTRAARLELEWWIAHRERAAHPPQHLRDALAGLQAALYHVLPARFAEHARLRADAMLLRDAKAEHGEASAQDWAEIGGLLRASWQSLWDAVNGRPAHPQGAYRHIHAMRRACPGSIVKTIQSRIPALAEPWFLALNAKVEIHPAMNAADLAKAAPAMEQVVRKYASRTMTA